MKKVALVFIAICCLSSPLLAQDRCATVPYNKNLLNKNGINESTEQFEQWLKQKIGSRKSRAGRLQTTAEAAYKIPVVVHIIANNDDGTFGTAHESITNAEVISQINVLNNDFRRLNADKTNTPAEFESVAGSMDIEFVLAKSDPNGDPTTGIIRKYVAKTSWNPDISADDTQLKASSYWPSDDYLNLWVANLSGFYIGYAQFPFSTLVGGLNDNKSALTDGVAIDFTTFGVGSSDPKFNLGRSATHEVAHYLGLRHIWGDDNDCTGVEDYVSDTPNQSDETTGCPPHPQVDCSTNKMFQNFLDYTDDACMNLFTQGQVDRMITVLENSDRRSSLLVSPGLVAPSGLGEDLKITSIISPSPVTCSTTELKFTLHNIGSPTITSFIVNHKIDNGPIITTEFPNVNYPDIIILSGEDNIQITIPLTISEGEHALSFEVYSPNGVADANPANSDTTINILVNNNQDFIPLLEQFDLPSTNWVTFNPNSGTVWNSVETNFRNSFYFNAYDNPQVGEQSWLVSPVLDFSSTSTASMFFDYSYRYLSVGTNNDRLQILASTDCGNTYDLVLFDKSGQNLFDESNDAEWFPSDEPEWKTNQFKSLNDLADQPDVRIAFVAENQNGNNIFIDNIEFFISDDPVQLGDEVKRYIVYWVDRGNADITFNLPERQTVAFKIIDTMGRVLAESSLPNILNQTISVPVSESSTGLYIIHMHIGSKYYTTKVYLSH